MHQQERMEHAACLLLGSNIQPEANIPLAIAHLREQLCVVQSSSLWQSKAVGSDGADFLNCALLVSTPLDAATLKQQVLRPLEAKLGRVRTSDKNAPRTIDIDIIVFDGVLLDQSLWEHAHLAVPVAELLPACQAGEGALLKDVAWRLQRATEITAWGEIPGFPEPFVMQIFPVKRKAPLHGLYLGQNLQGDAKKLERSIVIADFLTDKHGVIATASASGDYQIPPAIKNACDWRLFQELMAQTDVIISTGAYFKRLATLGNPPQEILYQFDAGNPFAMLGDWRLKAGYASRNPDLAVISRHLDFELPDELLGSNRRITVFTTDDMAKSARASMLRNSHITIIGCGATGVDGGAMVNTLANTLGYRVIMMTSGPAMLELLLAAQSLDVLYVTQAQVEIPREEPAMAQTMVSADSEARLLEVFTLAHEYHQADVIAEDGSRMAQRFLRYDRRSIAQG